MSVRADDKLRTFEQLNQQPLKIPKACAVGLVIDSTNAYFDETKLKFVKKIKLVDDTYNTQKFNPHQKYPYITVFFYSPKADALPNPRAIGDVLYLRRFSFGKYNDSFQGHYLEAQYCSWALLKGDTTSNDPEQYQVSRSGIDLTQEKYENLLVRVGELRKFSRNYLTNTSILSILPVGIVPKDTDLIVRVLKVSQEGFRLSDGKEELVLRDVNSFAKEGDFAKLRSVVRLANQGHSNVIISNNFTSLISIPEWTYDSQLFIRKKQSVIQIEEDSSIYTSLAQLNSLPLNEIQNKKYFVKVEVASVSTNQFANALNHYDENKKTLSDTPRKGTVPIYKFNFVVFDQSLTKNHKFSEIWLFSYDGKGSDFVERVNLADLNEFSNYTEENSYFKNRIESILNAEHVKMTVQVLSDGKGNRILRALSVN